jgi:hypothetical protein
MRSPTDADEPARLKMAGPVFTRATGDVVCSGEHAINPDSARAAVPAEIARRFVFIRGPRGSKGKKRFSICYSD